MGVIMDFFRYCGYFPSLIALLVILVMIGDSFFLFSFITFVVILSNLGALFFLSSSIISSTLASLIFSCAILGVSLLIVSVYFGLFICWLTKFSPIFVKYLFISLLISFKSLVIVLSSFCSSLISLFCL